MKYFLMIIFSSFLMSGTSYAQSTSLFNGKNLDGWKIYGTEKWYVRRALDM